MENKDDNLSFIGSIKNFSQTLFKYVSDLVLLATLEAQLAKKSLLHICVLVLIAFILVFTVWLGIFVLMIVSLMALGLALLPSLGIVIGINILLLAIIVFSIFRLKSNLYFPSTRKQLSFKSKEK